jgi:hypothetical protein
VPVLDWIFLLVEFTELVTFRTHSRYTKVTSITFHSVRSTLYFSIHNIRTNASEAMTTMNSPHSPRSVVSNLDRSPSLSPSSSQTQQGSSVLFPWKLHEMLRNCVKDGKEGVVSWLPDGKAFKVHNVGEFVNNILPLHFKQSKYKSFQRQLNLWGFERLTTGPDKGAYWHTQFLRDDPGLCKHLTRQRAKKSSSGASTSSGSSPIPSSVSSLSGSKSSTSSSPNSSAKATSVLHPPILVPSIKPVGSVGASDAIPSVVLGPRQVSESSLESFGELLKEFDTNVESALDLAEFEGFTFHLLDQERCEELNLEFKFDEGNRSQQQQTQLPQTSEEPILDEESNVHTLLRELEQGTFGTPKTKFDAVVCDLAVCSV